MNKKTALVAKDTFILSWKKVWYVISVRAECVKTKVHQPMLEKKMPLETFNLGGKECVSSEFIVNKYVMNFVHCRSKWQVL